MFTSVLVANRGEIACRIFRTARRLGLATVAVYSDADAGALHVREADRAVRLGPAPAADSYLRGDLVIRAALDTGAEAIHPGYGFLSENADFAEAVIAAGLIWIGPTPAAIRAMGLKDEAKRLAIAAGVPVLEGYQGEDQSEERLLKAAKDIGFPVLIKAVAGGGGRGIREVLSADTFKDQLASAQREAKAAFGNYAVLIERLVQRPRHIEVQVFGDKHGSVVHLFERDCSLQRRRQKVIEEAPAPGMTEDVRAAMTSAAVTLARAVSYENAGTVEFIVDGSGPLRADRFWFLEMNTRLQVEHPVTELVTDQDLVEWQFRVAAGEALPKTQAQLRLNGHALEARICAENPSDGFRPSVGRIAAFSATRLIHNARRIDAGFEGGDTVPSAYDSLLAKAMAWGTTRERATADLCAKLSGLLIAGIDSNVGFLVRCLSDPGFREGAVDTGLIADRGPALTEPAPQARAAAAAIAARLLTGPVRGAGAWQVRDGWRMNAPRQDQVWVEDRDGVVAAAPAPSADDAPLAGVLLDDGRVAAVVDGDTHVFTAPGRNAAVDLGTGGDEVKAPLPGKLVLVSVSAGQTVRKGDGLVLLEAMKMEHTLKAPRDGVIAEVAALVGSQVKEGAILVRLVPSDAGV